MPNSPCVNCENRKLGCHSKCFQFLVWSLNNEDIKKKRYEENELNSFVIERTIQTKEDAKSGKCGAFGYYKSKIGKRMVRGYV